VNLLILLLLKVLNACLFVDTDRAGSFFLRIRSLNIQRRVLKKTVLLIISFQKQEGKHKSEMASRNRMN